MKQRILCLLLSVLLLLSVVACNKNTPVEGDKNQSSEEDVKSTDKENDQSDASKTTDTPVEIKWLGYPTKDMYPSNDAYITQELNKRFNVKLDVQKANPNKDQELYMLFASDIIPDHFLVHAKGVQRIVDEGLTRDIPETMLKEIAPNFYNMVMTYHPNVIKQYLYEDGNFKAIPEGRGELFPMTAIRTDWLENVGAEIPTNLEELEEVCRLFTEEDPDGDGKRNTYATFLNTGYVNIQTIAAAFGISLPGGTVKDDSWMLDNNDNLVKAQVSDNYKEMLKYVANLYKKGYIYPDITIKAENVDALFSDGVIGMRTASWTAFLPKYRPNEWFAMTFNKNPDATTDFLPPLKGLDGKEAVFEKESSVWRYMCVGRDTSDEKLEKILEIIEAQMTDMEVHNLVWRGTEGVHYTVDEEGMAILKEEYSTPEMQAEVGIKYFIANFRNEEQSILSHGKDSLKLNEIQSTYKTRNQLIPSGTPIESVNEYGADVKKIEEEFYVNAVTGTWDIDSKWDEYVENWYKAGGDKITEEVNEIYNKMYKK